MFGLRRAGAGLLGLLLVAGAWAGEGNYRVGLLEREGVRIHTLKDVARGERAGIAPSLGANCLFLSLSHEGRVIDLIPPVDLAALRAEPTQQGIPVLFPFPGVVPEGRYDFGGRESRLTPSYAVEDNYHGFAATTPWRTVEHAADADGAWLTMELAPGDVPDCARQYPFAFRLRLTYRLAGGVLRAEFSLVNEGAETMPFGLGLHPYFRLPPVPESTVEDLRFRLDARSFWRGEDNWRRARRLPVEPENDPRGGLVPRTGLGEHYTDFATPGGWSSCFLEDRRSGVSLVLRADSAFPVWVLFVPERQPAVVSIEAYTAIPNAINHPADAPEAAPRLLPPAGRFAAAMEITLAARAR